jgi:hypothetical protein
MFMPSNLGYQLKRHTLSRRACARRLEGIFEERSDHFFCFSFDVGRSMFDVGRSSFNPFPTSDPARLTAGKL